MKVGVRGNDGKTVAKRFGGEQRRSVWRIVKRDIVSVTVRSRE